MSQEVKFEDNSNKIKAELKNAEKEILYAIGLKWQTLATKIITANKEVDTGRLRGSLTFVTPDKVGGSISKVKDNKSSDFLSGKAPEKTVIVGSNVEYAVKVEISNPKGPYLKPSIMSYRDVYKNLAEQILKK